ncbi:hypothetical protein MRX96_042451 [Rhipicephalus microplus]
MYPTGKYIHTPGGNEGRLGLFRFAADPSTAVREAERRDALQIRPKRHEDIRSAWDQQRLDANASSSHPFVVRDGLKTRDETTHGKKTSVIELERRLL